MKHQTHINGHIHNWKKMASPLDTNCAPAKQELPSQQTELFIAFDDEQYHCSLQVLSSSFLWLPGWWTCCNDRHHKTRVHQWSSLLSDWSQHPLHKRGNLHVCWVHLVCTFSGTYWGRTLNSVSRCSQSTFKHVWSFVISKNKIHLCNLEGPPRLGSGCILSQGWCHWCLGLVQAISRKLNKQKQRSSKGLGLPSWHWERSQ